MAAARSKAHYARKRQAVHERILTAAIEQFEATGIEDTRIDDICARAVVAQKTFFNHFANRHQLVREIAERFLEAVVGAIEEARSEPGSTGDRLERLFARVAAAAEHAPPLRRGLVIEIIRHLHGDPTQQRMGQILRERFAGMLRDGVRAGSVTRDHSVPTLAAVVAGSFYALMLDWASLADFPVRARARTMARFLKDAISPR